MLPLGKPKPKKMKTTLLTIASLAIFFNASAQREVGSAQRFDAPIFSADRAIDTIAPPIISVSGTVPSLLGAQGGGFVAGNNGYGDIAKGQTLNITGSANVIGIGAWIGAKVQTDGSPNSVIAFNLYPATGTGTASTGPVATAPGAVIASSNLAIADVDTTSAGSGGFAWVSVAPTLVSDAFVVALNFTGLAAGDTVGIIHTADGVSSGIDQSWEQWNDNSWHTFAEAWPLDIDLYMFAIIDDGAIGIEEAATVNGMRMSFTNGNMINDVVVMQYALDNAASTQLVVTNASGKILVNESLGVKAASVHNKNINASDWSAGVYFVSLISNGKTLTKQVVK